MVVQLLELFYRLLKVVSVFDESRVIFDDLFKFFQIAVGNVDVLIFDLSELVFHILD